MNIKNESTEGCETNDSIETETNDSIETEKNDQNRPVVLCEFDAEFQAVALLAQLQANGIEASTTGGFTAGFRAESPGLVQVVVKQGDAQRAKQVWDEFRRSKPEIDWSKVDVGDPEE